MNRISTSAQRETRSSQEGDAVALSLRVIHETPLGRYVIISCWALLLAVMVPLAVAFTWYVATMAAGAVRTLVESRMQAAQDKYGDQDRKRRYALVAMASCSFWAVAPVLAFSAEHEFGVAATMLFIATGYMLAFSQFRATPVNALIVTSPYAAAYVICLALAYGGPYFWALAASAPVLATGIAYVLIFGYRTQASADRTAQERRVLIEELSAARVAAERASEAKSMFLANMSHEIRTPMNGVLGMAELLASTRLDSRQRIFAETIHKSGAALLTIINDILDFSKIEAGKLELENAAFDLRASVEDVAALVASRAQEKQIEVIVRFQPDLPNVLVGDGGRVRQVVTNLVGNAVKFTEAGHVLINVSGRAQSDEATVRIEVTDTGVGISSEKLERIFDAFQQADPTTTRKFGGTGLGLSISSRLVEAMGGKIGVTSKIGKGSTFWIELTLPARDSGALTQTATFEAEGRRVLIVDDIDVNRHILKEQLASWGFAPDAAPGGAEALAMMRAAAAEGRSYALAVLDFHMPEMDGEELARRIKEDPAISDTLLMALTSVDGGGDARRFREIGVAAYLVKPVRSALLFETIAEVVKRGERAPAENGADAARPAAQPAERASPILSDKCTILLAEDNEVNQLVIRHMLDPNAYELVVASNGREAVEAFEEDPARVDIILMDVSMPQMDGYEATQAIRRIEDGSGLAQTPIVCLTAHVMAKDVELAHASGMDDFLSKPVSKEKLERALARWVGAASVGAEDSSGAA